MLAKAADATPGGAPGYAPSWQTGAHAAVRADTGCALDKESAPRKASPARIPLAPRTVVSLAGKEVLVDLDDLDLSGNLHSDAVTDH